MNYLGDVLTAHGGYEFLMLLASAAAKSTLLFAFVALLCLSFRRFSAAARHSLWISVVCASLLLPCLSFQAIWELPVLPATESVLAEPGTSELTGDDLLKETLAARIDESVGVRNILAGQGSVEFQKETLLAAEVLNPSESSSGAAAFFSQRAVKGILAVWFVVASALLFRLCVGFSATNLLSRRSAEFKDAGPNELFSALLTELDLNGKVRLLRSESTLMPVVCGVTRPKVLLPADADGWSPERLRIVLLHELTHVARRDCLTQTLAQLACAFYWFNPLVWYAARRLRVEREQACDDRVLSVGTKPSDYAHHLLEIARSAQNRTNFEWSGAATVAMARKSQFEGRLLAILGQRTEGCRTTRLITASLIAVICVLFLSLAVIRPTPVDAQKQQFSQTNTDDERVKAETFLPDSFPEMSENSPTVRDSEVNESEAAGKQKRVSASNDKSEERDSTGERILESVEWNIRPDDVKPNSQQNTSEAIREQAAAPVQTPEAIAPPLAAPPEASPFVNAGYGQKSESRTQNRSGDFIDEMASVGYTNLSVDELIRLKTYGVTADFVRGWRAQGFDNLTPKTIVNLRIYNVTPAYAVAMAAAGYTGLALKDLTNARIYGVTPEYVRAIRGAGYPSLSLGQMINFKIYGVTPELVRAARSRLGDLTPKQMISLKISGVLNKVEDKKKGRKIAAGIRGFLL